MTAVSILILMVVSTQLISAKWALHYDGDRHESLTKLDLDESSLCASNRDCRAGRVCQLVVDVGRKGRCVCASSSHCNRRHRHHRPVCGSDGRLYPSHCHLHRAACVSGTKIRIHQRGSCGTHREADGHRRPIVGTRATGRIGHPVRKPFTKFLSVKSGDHQAELLCDIELTDAFDKIEWLKNGELLSTDELVGKSKNASRLLTLSDVSPEDAGQYRCRSFIYNQLAQNISLAVIAAPRVRVYPSMLVRRVGESADFYCDIQATLSVSRRRWQFDAEPLELRPGEEKIKTSDSGHWLHISNLDRNHTGIYSCRVENMAGASEVAGSLYVRNPAENAVTSYPLSDATFDTSVLLLHAGGASVWNGDSCQRSKDPTEASVADNWDLSTDWDVTLCENLIACDWGAAVLAGRSWVFAAQPSLGRLLRFKPGQQRPSGQKRTYDTVQLNCAVTSLSYQQLADRVWAACSDGRIFAIDSATLQSPPVGPLWRQEAGETVLATPDGVNGYVVVRTRSWVDGAPVTISVLDRSGQKRLAVQLTVEEDSAQRARGLRQMATVLPQGGILLVYSTFSNAESVGSNSTATDGAGPPIVAVDLRTGNRLNDYLSARGRAGDGSPARGCLFVSPYGDFVLRVSGQRIVAYKIRPNGKLAPILSDTAGVRLRSVAFHRGTDAKQRVLAVTNRPGCLLTVWLEKQQFQLTLDESFSDKSVVTAPVFGDRALLHSTDSAQFLRTDRQGGVQPAAGDGCGKRLFLQLQQALWLID
ncbi:hypothetical protein BOX15_Mlig026856g2 [Macrostomum lignano]|uniref:Kazal-like domain-containing protein n=1 Tax=Macrostomum lignano TaxID=282301 RepID=A0A267FLN0_9PLAT|nr:hypothetical protein BOX15_Mlig026856g2 [Macrostomum lignano]